jgi:hypothetical protein
MKLLKTLVLVLFSASLYAQQDTTLLANWKSHPITENKDTLLQYNHSPSMIVYREKGKIKVKREVQRFVDDLPFKIVQVGMRSPLVDKTLRETMVQKFLLAKTGMAVHMKLFN